MVSLAWPYEGQVLNRAQGRPTDEGLAIEVRGKVRGTATVTVNGADATTAIGEFTAPLVLQPGPNLVCAEASGGFGRGRHAVNVWYDPNGRKRYRLSVDDNSFWLREIGRHPGKYASLFDCFYFRMWRDLHDRYGLKVVLNIYYETEDGFTLDQFPDDYRGEFEANAEWLKLAWHARANLPHRPYEYAGYDQVAADHDLVADHIRRFAGEETFSLPTVVHWAETTKEGVQALVDRGVRNLSGIFERRSGRQAGVYHLRDERADLVEQCGKWIDAETGIAFSVIDLCGNQTPLDEIVPRLEAIEPDPRNADILDLFTHEQYFWDFYRSYLPDHPDRMEAMVKWATEHGYEPCWFHEGLFGGPEIRSGEV